MKNKIVIDIGNSYIKVADEQKNIYKFKIDNLNQLQNYLKQNTNDYYYIGSVNKETCSKVVSLLKKNNIKYKIISNKDFLKFIKLDKDIEINQVGLDILAIVYGIEDNDYIFVNAGTALLFIKFSNQLDGVIISSNIFYNTDVLTSKINIDFNLIKFDDFGKNNDQAFSSAINLQFIKPLNKLIQKHNIKKIYYHNVNKSVMKNIDVATITEDQNATIKGYIKLVNNI